uniref:ANK_REP_REGION domain-containing protein n=1 Tax=Macrostomum lignano TaxID=282301 RepID=A0A1I8IPJ9_9PLAT
IRGRCRCRPLRAASAELRDNCGRTPLLAAAEIVHLATLGGHGEVLNYLLDQGAEIDARDGEGATAWDYAKQRRLHYCKLILASHYRQKLCSRLRAGPDFGALFKSLSISSLLNKAKPRRLGSAAVPVSKRCHHSAVLQAQTVQRGLCPAAANAGTSKAEQWCLQQFDVVRSTAAIDFLNVHTLNLRYPDRRGRHHAEIEVAIVIGTSAFDPAGVCRRGVSRDWRLLLKLHKLHRPKAEPEPEPEVTAEIEADASAVVAARPVEGRRASEPTAAVVRRERTTRNSAPDPQRLHPRPPLGSPDRRLIRGAQPPYKLPHRPSQSGAAAAEKETDDEAEESESTLPPPPPEFQTSVEEQVASGDDEGDKEPPLDTERMQRGRSRRSDNRHNPPRVSVEPQTAPAPADAAAHPLTLRLLRRLRRRQAADGNLREEKRSVDLRTLGSAAAFLAPETTASGQLRPVSCSRWSRMPSTVSRFSSEVPPMASPRSASASANLWRPDADGLIRGRLKEHVFQHVIQLPPQHGLSSPLCSSAVLPAKRGLQGRPDQLVAPDAEHRSALVLRFADYCQQQRHWCRGRRPGTAAKGAMTRLTSLSIDRRASPTELVDGAISSIWVGIRTQEVGQRYSVAEPAIASDVGLSFAGNKTLHLLQWVTRRLRVSSLTNAAAGVDGLEFNSRTTSGRISHPVASLEPSCPQLTAVRLSSGRSQLLASQQEVQAAGAAEACAALCQTVPAERLPAPAIDEAQEAASSRDKKKCAEPITDSNSRLAAAQASRSETAVRRRKIFASSSGGSLGKPLFGMLAKSQRHRNQRHQQRQDIRTSESENSARRQRLPRRRRWNLLTSATAFISTFVSGHFKTRSADVVFLSKSGIVLQDTNVAATASAAAAVAAAASTSAVAGQPMNGQAQRPVGRVAIDFVRDEQSLLRRETVAFGQQVGDVHQADTGIGRVPSSADWAGAGRPGSRDQVRYAQVGRHWLGGTRPPRVVVPFSVVNLTVALHHNRDGTEAEVGREIRRQAGRHKVSIAAILAVPEQRPLRRLQQPQLVGALKAAQAGRGRQDRLWRRRLRWHPLAGEGQQRRQVAGHPLGEMAISGPGPAGRSRPVHHVASRVPSIGFRHLSTSIQPYYCQQQRSHWVAEVGRPWNGCVKGRHDPPDKLVQVVSLKVAFGQQAVGHAHEVRVSSLTNAAAGVDGSGVQQSHHIRLDQPSDRCPSGRVANRLGSSAWAQEAASSRGRIKKSAPSRSRIRTREMAAAQASRSETAVRRRKIFASSSGGSLGKPLFGHPAAQPFTDQRLSVGQNVAETRPLAGRQEVAQPLVAGLNARHAAQRIGHEPEVLATWRNLAPISTEVAAATLQTVVRGGRRGQSRRSLSTEEAAVKAGQNSLESAELIELSAAETGASGELQVEQQSLQGPHAQVALLERAALQESQAGIQPLTDDILFSCGQLLPPLLRSASPQFTAGSSRLCPRHQLPAFPVAAFAFIDDIFRHFPQLRPRWPPSRRRFTLSRSRPLLLLAAFAVEIVAEIVACSWPIAGAGVHGAVVEHIVEPVLIAPTGLAAVKLVQDSLRRQQLPDGAIQSAFQRFVEEAASSSSRSSAPPDSVSSSSRYRSRPSCNRHRRYLVDRIPDLIRTRPRLHLRCHNGSRVELVATVPDAAACAASCGYRQCQLLAKYSQPESTDISRADRPRTVPQCAGAVLDAADMLLQKLVLQQFTQLICTNRFQWLQFPQTDCCTMPSMHRQRQQCKRCLMEAR